MSETLLHAAETRLLAAQREVAKWSAFIKAFHELQGREVADPLPPAGAVTRANIARYWVANPGRLLQTERVAGDIIKEAGKPVLSGDMLAQLQERGVEIGGKDPASTLAARLSRATTIEFVRGQGWALSSDRLKDEAADPLSGTEESAASDGTSNDAVTRGEVEHHNMTE